MHVDDIDKNKAVSSIELLRNYETLKPLIDRIDKLEKRVAELETDLNTVIRNS